jgi:hypothetical protein
MSEAKGVRKEQPIPAGYIRAAKASCRKCHDEYNILFRVHELDQTLAKQLSAFLSGYLEGEHVDPKFTAHLEVYEPLDWTDLAS